MKEITAEEIKGIIESNKLPSDELDKLLDNLIGNFLPIGLVILFGYLAFFVEETETSASTESMLLLFKFSTFWLVYNLLKKLKEKNLKKLQTGLSLQENTDLIIRLIESKQLQLIGRKDNYFEIHIRSWMNGGCKLVFRVTPLSHIVFH
jgi:amino acid permease